MSITYNHVQLSFVDSGGNVKVFYPKNTGSDVTIDRSNNSNIPSDVTTIQILANKLTKVSFSNSYNDLSNTPTLGTAAAKNVPSSGNASTTQVVMGNDTRLSDSRVASDVYSWAKASTKPTYTKSEVGLGNVGNFKAVSTIASQGLTDTEKSNARTNIGLGSAAVKGVTTSVTSGSSDLITSGGVYTTTNYIDNKYKGGCFSFHIDVDGWADAYVGYLGITKTTTLKQMIELLCSSSYNPTCKIIINTNTQGINTNSYQVIVDILNIFGVTSIDISTFEITVNNIGNGRVLIKWINFSAGYIKYAYLFNWASSGTIKTVTMT